MTRLLNTMFDLFMPSLTTLGFITIYIIVMKVLGVYCGS